MKYICIVICCIVVSVLGNAQLVENNKKISDEQDIHHSSYLFEGLELNSLEILDPVLRDSVELDTFIDSIMNAAHLPGVATWASLNGEVIWQKCYGYANLDDSIPVADTTIFALRSISKTVTGTAIMQLWERGEFDLDEDINNFLPDTFEVHNPFYPDSVITFRMLMTHTSSITHNVNLLAPLIVPGGDSPIPLGEFLYNYLVPGGIYFDSINYQNCPPGEQYCYSNTGIALLGYLVEVIEDSFPVHCQDSIFDPLSMYETSWFLADLDTNNVAVPYHWNGFEYERCDHEGFPWYPAAQLRTSVVELAQHLTAIEQFGEINGTRILDSTTVDLMRTEHFSASTYHKMGLTWIHYYWGSRWIWVHDGAGPGISTIYGFCPEENSAAIVLSNGEDGYTGTYVIATALFDYAQELSVREMDERDMSVSSLQVYPNPFKDLTTVSFSSGQGAESMDLRIYDAAGRSVRHWNNTAVSVSDYVTWNGTDDTGRELTSGVYFVTLRAGEHCATQKVLLVR